MKQPRNHCRKKSSWLFAIVTVTERGYLAALSLLKPASACVPLAFTLFHRRPSPLLIVIDISHHGLVLQPFLASGLKCQCKEEDGHVHS